MDEFKRLPAVSRSFIECAGNRSLIRAKTVQDTHGQSSCAEWTGVPFRVAQERGLKGAECWFVAEGGRKEGRDEHADGEGHGEPYCLRQNGQAVRPQNGYPLRLINPGWRAST